MLTESERRRGRFDLPGAITGTAGLVLLVYGLTRAAASLGSTAHWSSPVVYGSLAASAVLLSAFAVIEVRSKGALLPVAILRDRNRAGANLIMLVIGTAMFGLFFFLTLFVQEVWHYSALRAGIASLPIAATIMIMSALAAQLIPRIGARPLLLAGSAVAAGGMYWLSRITEHGSYVSELLLPMIAAAAGLGLLFMPVTLIALSKVRDEDSGAASSLPNAGQQIVGSIGLAVLGTVAWTIVASSIKSQTAAAAAAGQFRHAGTTVPAAIFSHALATGFARAFEVSGAIALLALVLAIATIRVKRGDFGGAADTTVIPARPEQEPGSITAHTAAR